MRAVGDAGLTASDVAVVGYDNTKMASHPLISLTSIDQSGELMGRRVIELLLERFAGRTEPVHVRTTPRLIVRGSSSEARDVRGSRFDNRSLTLILHADTVTESQSLTGCAD